MTLLLGNPLGNGSSRAAEHPFSVATRSKVLSFACSDFTLAIGLCVTILLTVKSLDQP